jgi:hypothetical protein
MGPEHENRPSLMGWHPLLGNVVEGSATFRAMPPIIDDVAEVFVVMATLSQIVVLGNPPMRVVVG